jgi:hypothetical protein
MLSGQWYLFSGDFLQKLIVYDIELISRRYTPIYDYVILQFITKLREPFIFRIQNKQDSALSKSEHLFIP